VLSGKRSYDLTLVIDEAAMMRGRMQLHPR
jgi:hypothetical protein